MAINNNALAPSEEVDALHEQYETAVEDNESDDDQMIGASDSERMRNLLRTKCLTLHKVNGDTIKPMVTSANGPAQRKLCDEFRQMDGAGKFSVLQHTQTTARHTLRKQRPRWILMRMSWNGI
jgi:hypothetical protein